MRGGERKSKSLKAALVAFLLVAAYLPASSFFFSLGYLHPLQTAEQNLTITPAREVALELGRRLLSRPLVLSAVVRLQVPVEEYFSVEFPRSTTSIILKASAAGKAFAFAELSYTVFKLSALRPVLFLRAGGAMPLFYLTQNQLKTYVAFPDGSELFPQQVQIQMEDYRYKLYAAGEAGLRIGFSKKYFGAALSLIKTPNHIYKRIYIFIGSGLGR